MLDLIGATLTNASAIAVSPIPIIAVILMLMTPRSTSLGFAFLLGWLGGILVATTVFVLLADAVPSGEENGAQPILGIVQLILGAALLFLGWRQWRSRPTAGTTPELPAWMSKIDAIRVPAAAGLAFALAAANPKNLLVAASAGATIGHGELDAASLLVVILVFGVIAASTVMIPVLFNAVAPKAAASALTSIRAWLTTNNSVIMTVLFVVLGANVIGKGLGAF